MFLTATTIIINFLLAFILLQTVAWTIANEFGVLQWLPQILLWLMSSLIISPKTPKMHHHYELTYTDTNYGSIFSIWNRLFRIFKTLPKEEIFYGIDTHMRIEEHNELNNLIKIPFQI
jgi:sterol desaturase/sphingolipid hydroxylase (fatty acid hydroxylase superfamily)